MKKLLLSTLAIAALTFTSCSTDDDVNGPTTDPNGLSLSGDITSNRTLTANNEYILDGALFVKSGATLTIEAGTTISATAGGTNVYVLVERGGRIVANGTAAAPIRFTSSVNQPAAWGGLILNGNAFISGQNPQGQNVAGTEVNQALLFGGNNDTESSGTLNYVIIEFTGARIDGEAEHNGLTLNGVGSGTTLSNIWIANGDDDGIEFFGGSVNASNIFVLNAKDDMFDFSQGYRGTCTNLYGLRAAGYTAVTEDPRGIEADGNLDGNSPSDNTQSNFTVSGVTLINRSNAQITDFVKVRRGATANVTNAFAGTFGSTPADDFIDLGDSRGNATSATSITATAAGTTDGTDVKNPSNSTVTVNATQTGASVSAFAWTGYSFQ